MILPLVAFLLLGEPAMSPTDSPPIVFRIPEPASGQTLAQMEFCIDTIDHVAIGFDDFERRPVLNISLNETGQQRLATITARYVEYEAQITVDGEVLVSPRIMEPLLSGGLQISGIDTIAQAELLRQAARGHCSLPKANTE